MSKNRISFYDKILTDSRLRDFSSHVVELQGWQVTVIVTIKSLYELQSFALGIM